MPDDEIPTYDPNDPVRGGRLPRDAYADLYAAIENSQGHVKVDVLKSRRPVEAFFLLPRSGGKVEAQRLWDLAMERVAMIATLARFDDDRVEAVEPIGTAPFWPPDASLEAFQRAHNRLGEPRTREAKSRALFFVGLAVIVWLLVLLAWLA